MLSRFLRFLMLAFLCVLLAYAPELFAAVSAPYTAKLPERSLLRIALCTQDADAVSSFYTALNGFRDAFPSIHIRILRVSETQLASLPEPLPDVFVLSETVSYDAIGFLAFSPSSEPSAPVQTLHAFHPAKGEKLLCAMRTDAYAPDAAEALISYLYSSSQQSGGTS